MEQLQRYAEYMDFLEEVRQYLGSQYSKGLVLRYSILPPRVRYSTHWGTHREVIQPEIARLMARYDIQLSIDVEVQVQSGFWINAKDKEEDSAWVEVTLRG